MLLPKIAQHVASGVCLRATAAAAAADVFAAKVRDMPQLGSNAVFARQELAVKEDGVSNARAVIDADRASFVL